MINHKDYFPPDSANNLRRDMPYDKYLSYMSETREEAFERLNKYCQIPYHQNIFNYLDDNLIRVINGQRLIYTEFNFSGGRYGKKTFEIADHIAKMIIACISNNKRVAIYCFRYFGSAIGELRDEIDNALDRYHLDESSSKVSFQNGEYNFRNTYNRPTWKFIGGSFIQIWGIYKANDRTVALKGLASAQGFDYAITFAEEANEFTNANFQEIEIALRGAKEQVYFKAANPDVLENDYIWYCNENLKYNEQELETKGYQFRKFIDPDTGRGKVFMHTNYMINPYLSTAQVQSMKELEKRDKYKYRIWGKGMPGSLQTAVFAPYLHSVEKSFTGDKIIAGVDLGYASSSMGHPTRVIVSELDITHKRVHPIAEYSHSNATDTHKNINQIIDDILKTFIELGKINRYRNIMKNKGVEVQVDYGAGGLVQIDLLNNQARNTFDTDVRGPMSKWIKFVPVDKGVMWYIKDRIEMTISLLNFNKLTISSSDTPVLYNEMKLIAYKKPTGAQMVNTEPKMLDVNDDGWDALCYSLMPYSQTLLDEVYRDPLYEKEKMKLINSGRWKPDTIKW